MIPTLVPIDMGFIEKEKDIGMIFIIVAMIMIVSGISIIAYTIYRSYQQKQKRLDLLRCREYNAKLTKSENQLRNDRQVKIAMNYVENLEA